MDISEIIKAIETLNTTLSLVGVHTEIGKQIVTKISELVMKLKP